MSDGRLLVGLALVAVAAARAARGSRGVVRRSQGVPERFRCVDARYDQDKGLYDSVEAFLAACAPASWHVKLVEEQEGEFYDGTGRLVLVRESGSKGVVRAPRPRPLTKAVLRDEMIVDIKDWMAELELHSEKGYERPDDVLGWMRDTRDVLLRPRPDSFDPWAVGQRVMKWVERLLGRWNFDPNASLITRMQSRGRDLEQRLPAQGSWGVVRAGRVPKPVESGVIIGHVGDLAYLDAFGGLVPCKVLEIREKAIEVLVTAKRTGYPKGEIVTATRSGVVPRPAVFWKSGTARLRPFRWEPEGSKGVVRTGRKAKPQEVYVIAERIPEDSEFAEGAAEPLFWNGDGGFDEFTSATHYTEEEQQRLSPLPPNGVWQPLEVAVSRVKRWEKMMGGS